LQTTIGLGSRDISNELQNPTDKQFTINLHAIHNFYLNNKNSIYVNSQNFYLQSDRYLTNELYRFGGLNSIRGFAENSLEAYFSSTFQTEYRYVIAPTLYAHTILDYSIFKNKSGLNSMDVTQNLFGLGLGLGLQTANGLFKLSMANGRAKNQDFQFINTIVHISYNVKF
jgi:hemolysin activation/secretion protein